MIKSSINVSFTGGQVGWITKTSAPRTFSLNWTKISPSEKRETSLSPSGTRRYWAISSARARFAFPEKSFSSYAMGASLMMWLGREDSNLRIRDPKSRALPLGHAPSNLTPGGPWPDASPFGGRLHSDRRATQRPDRPALPRPPRDPGADLPRLLPRPRDSEHRRAAARHDRAQRPGRHQGR